MRYKPNSDYVFECELCCSGIDAKEIENSLKDSIRNLIKSDKVKFACLSNETKNAKDSSLKVFSAIEAIQCVKGGKILHIGRIPDYWIEQLKKEMEEKEEIDKKRLLHLEDCIMIIVEGEKNNNAIILDRRGIYTVSSSPPK